jgi:hypothetical protein
MARTKSSTSSPAATAVELRAAAGQKLAAMYDRLREVERIAKRSAAEHRANIALLRGEIDRLADQLRTGEIQAELFGDGGADDSA